MKRVTCRAIIIENNKIVAMYREKNDRVYYTFPGGGVEEGESLQLCVVREVFEEFGINVEVTKKIYVYEDTKTIQHFFLCKWIDGELGEGEGEEFQPDRNSGIYLPVMLDINNLQNLPLVPPEVTEQFIKDFSIFGDKFDDKVKFIFSNF